MPAYPEGHPDIADDVLLATLLEKQRYASYMATQMCFNPDAITRWIRTAPGAGGSRCRSTWACPASPRSRS